MNKFSRILLSTTALFAASVASPGFTFAQVSQDSSDPKPAAGKAPIDVIVVTAQRRAQSLQETPVTVSALNSETLDDLNINEVQGLARTVPNMQLLPVTANPSNLQVGLRGGAEQAGGLITSEPVVGIYVDGVYRGRLQGSNMQLNDIERVEILRGPQGTLYGRNNFSGAIKVITRTPSASEQWANASLGYGSYDEVRADASIGGGLTEKLGGSLSVIYRDVGDGYIFNRATGEHIGKEENFAARGKLAFENEDFKAVFAASYSLDDNDGYIPVAASFPRVPSGPANLVTSDEVTPRFGTDPYVVQYPQESFGRTETYTATLDMSYDFGNTTVRSITGYVDLDDAWRWDLAGGLELAPDVYSASFDRTSDAKADQFTQELNFSGEIADGTINWIVGGFYFHESGDQSLSDNIPLFGLPQLDPTFLNVKTDSWAIFAQGDYAITDRLTVSLGARYTEDQKKFDASIQSGFGVPVPRTSVALDETFTSFTPRLGIDYRFSDNVFGYASIAKGFKAGGFNGLSVLNPTVLAAAFEPQKVWAYEAGIKADLLDRSLRTNLAVFYNDISALQQTALIGPGSFATQNVGNASIFGIEAEISATPAQGLNIFANIGYQDGDYGSLNPSAQAALSGATDLPLVSDWTLQGGFNYESLITDGFLFKIGADARYVGDYFPETTNSFLTKGYTRVNAFAAVGTEDKRWELRAEVQNLTDEVNYVSGLVSVPVPGLTVLKPRTWLVTLSYSM